MAEKLVELREKAFEKEVTNLEEELKKEEPDIQKVATQLRILSQKYEAYDAAHQKLLEELLSNGKDDDFLKAEEALSEMQRRLEIADTKGNVFLNAQTPVEQSRVNLPQLKLQQFSGDIRNWLRFWNSFQEIDNNPNISDSDKFQYLLNCIPPNTQARKCIDGFPVCAKNYAHAIKALNDTYGKDSTLVKVYVREIQQLVVKNANEKTRVDFMELVPALVCQIRNLEALGVTSDKCESILYPVVESCLPEEVLQAWQRNANHDDKLEPLISFLNEEVQNQMERSLARMDFSGSSTEKKKASPKGQKNDIPTATGMMAGSEENAGKGSNRCAFCNKHGHKSHKCRIAASKLNLAERQEALRKKNLCFICFQSGHRSTDCTSNVVCKKCSGKHHELMCRGDQSPAAQEQMKPNQMMMAPTWDYGNISTAASYFGGGHQPQQHYYQPMTPQLHHVQPGPAQQPVQRISQPPQQRPVAPRPPLNITAGWMKDGQQSNQQQQPPPPSGSGTVGFTNVTGERSTTLHTMLVLIATPEGNLPARVFIDEGSDKSYVLDSVATQTQCPVVGSKILRHQLFGGGVTEPQQHPLYNVTMLNVDGTAQMNFVMYGVTRIAQKIPKPKMKALEREVNVSGLPVHDQTYFNDRIQLLFGMDIAAQIWTGGFHRISRFVVMKETLFGWVLGGTQQQDDPVDSTQSCMVTSMMFGNMSEEDLWSLEMIGITDEAKSQTREDLERAAIHHFEQTVVRLPEGRYEVRLPFVDGHREIQSNRAQAISRLHAVTKDLRRDGYLEAYNEIFMDWLRKGIIEAVGCSGPMEYFLPHRHVVKESSTTPVRPVFDASAKAKGSPSLNDCLEKGPNMLELIPAVTCRFRRKRYGLVSDIAKAFLQMSVSPVDRDVLQFVWWKDLTCKELQILRHCRVVFGVKPSPFLLAATLQHHIRNEGHDDPVAAEQLLHSFYVDNSLTSHNTYREASEFKEKSEKLLLPAMMDLRGWEISYSEKKNVPVLGMLWNTLDDTLSLSLEGTMKKLEAPFTKRGLLSVVNSIFDPMGFAAPVTVAPKLLFQECCKKELKWDQALPTEIVEPFQKWKSQVPVLEHMIIPRWACSVPEEARVELHIFSDASTALYATCVFIRTESPDGIVNVQLLMCRTRVAPYKKKVTIPRLELLGCLLSVRLAADVKNYLQDRDIPCFYWTDSSTALAWIRSDKVWARFVQGRVDEIRKNSTPGEWRHVPGELNPADLPSRGCSAERLLQLKWWEGHAWLRQEKEEWPISQIIFNEEDIMQEAKKTVVCALVQVKTDVLDYITKFSSYYTALRVVAMILRYVDRLCERSQQRKAGAVNKLQLKKKKFQIRESTAEEIARAETCVVRYIQRTGFNGIKDDKLKFMSVFADSEGVLRTRTQLMYGNDDYHARCPAVLPSKHAMVKAIIQAEHEITGHAGVQTTMAIIRKRFWILKCRKAVSEVVNSCVTCRRFTAKRCQVPGAPLPKDRVADNVAFRITGVDLLGPLFLRGGDRVWVVLYTCAVYRCVHLEITSTLSTEGFIRTLRRFIARRGRPMKIYSDNGLNFVGCNNLFSQLDWEQVRRYSSVQRMEWIFNPPTAAWWGGWWERLVGLTKKLLRRILGKSVVDLEELSTIMCDVEGTLNQRPLTYMSDKSGDMIPLCPAYFMRDNALGHLPEADVVDSNVLKESAHRCQQLREELRARFRKDYLGQLQHRTDGKRLTVNPGDVVLIEHDDKKRQEWPLGVVQQVYPGRGNERRTALVRTKTGEFLRPLQRLFIMEAHVPEEILEETQSVIPDDAEQQTRFGRKIVKPNRLNYE